ncbi:MAG: type II secretion system major pseudopilin GspG [Caulobacter sp.]
MTARTKSEHVGGEDGYTLTEMLVVIAIIGLIAAVLTPSLMGQLGRSRVKAAELQLDSVAAAVETFHSDLGRYPTQEEGLQALFAAPSGEEAWIGPYVRSAKTLNDPWGQALIYRLEDEGQAFEIVSYGADRKEGGSGLKRDLHRPE